MSRFTAYDPTCCLNCGASFEASTKFCPSCGQKNRKNELTLTEWLREALSTFFHLEGKTANTLRDLFVPGKIATNIFNGQRQRYVHPFRLLVFSSLICFGLLSIKRYYFPDDEDGTISLDMTNDDRNLIAVGDSTATKVIENADSHPIASRMKTIDLLRAQLIHYDRFLLIKDSLARAGAQQDSAQRALLDTLGTFYTKPDDWLSRSGILKDGTFMSNGDTITLDPRDVAGLSAEEVIAKTNIDEWTKRLFLRKGIHAFQEGSESITNMLYGSLSWAVLIYVPFLALGYKLFYRRKLPLYTQHLTYAALLMSITLLMFGLTTLIESLLPIKILSTLALLGVLLYNILSDAKVFNVNKRHAIAKFSVLAVYGFITFAISLILWFLGTMLFV